VQRKNTNQETFSIILLISLLNFLVYILSISFTSYGIFRDELYYIACADRLDFGYVDHPPLSIWVLAIWKFIFGDGVFVIRIIPAIVSSATVFMIGLFTVRIGGGKNSVIISTITFLLTPIFLGMSTIYSMNTFDLFFWITSAYIFLRIFQTSDPKLWRILGIVIGLGLMNKTSMLWLCAGIILGTIFTPMREDLKTKYPYIAAGIALLIFSPYIIWNLFHDFAHLEFIRNAAQRKYGELNQLSFILDQILVLNPFSLLIWIPGIIFFFFDKSGRQFRAPAFIWLAALIILLVNEHSKGEYIAAAYQILFAGGAVMVVKWNAKRNRLKYLLVTPVIVTGILSSPYARPLLPPENFLAYQSFIGIKPPVNEGRETQMPQFYADMFGWEQMAKNVSNVYKTLPPDEQKRTVVYCSNYGKAGAMEYYKKKYPLPKVVCPHNSYWYWWDEAGKPSTIIIIGGEKEDHLYSLESVEEAGFHKTKYVMPYENNQRIFIGRGFKRSLEEIRKNNKLFI
jgi:4-amino-4-deoxy-L-arabinose transferase-like glycosyltransferase